MPSYLLKIAAVTLASLSFTSAAFAEYPEKPVNLIAGYAQGGSVDTYSRVLAGEMQKTLGVPVAVQNKPGASGMIALQYISGQAADGYSMLTQVTSGAAAKTASGDAPVDFRATMRPLALIGEVPAALMVSIDSPYETLADFVAAAEASPGSLRWAHPGRGGVFHVAPQAQFDTMSLDLKDVPFKGGTPTKQAIVAGQVDAGILGVQHIRGFETKMRVLGVMTEQRDPRFPDVPTFDEQGFDIDAAVAPIMIYTHSSVPEDIFQKMSVALEAAVKSEGYAAGIDKAGLLNTYIGPEEANPYQDAVFKLFGAD